MQQPDSILTETSYLWNEGRIHSARQHEKISEYLKGKLFGAILDIGERNPLTEILEQQNQVKIHNTVGDLDEDWWPECKEYRCYNTVIFSHVIEHLFNPLKFLTELKYFCCEDCKIYIATPIKPYWITMARCHFHEMNMFNFKRLMDRAGYHIIGWKVYSLPIPFRFSVRNWLRRIYKEYSIVTLTA